jgi:ElaB/YqjD/DUF883 family membrane-anchored ribosome-binding protein
VGLAEIRYVAVPPAVIASTGRSAAPRPRLVPSFFLFLHAGGVTFCLVRQSGIRENPARARETAASGDEVRWYATRNARRRENSMNTTMNDDPTSTGTTTKPVTVKTSRAAKVKELMPENFEALLRKAKDLPKTIESEVKDNPYRTLGIAMGVGFGLGALTGSRLARLFVVTAGGYALSEVARTRIKRLVDELAAPKE